MLEAEFLSLSPVWPLGFNITGVRSWTHSSLHSLNSKHVIPIAVKFGIEESIANWCSLGCGTSKTDNFTEILAYKRPTETYPLGDFNQIFTVCGQHHVQSRIKIWVDLLNGFWSYGGLSLAVCVLSQIFSAPWRRNCASEANMC